MRIMTATLVLMLTGLVILATTFRATSQPIESALDAYQQHWPGKASNPTDCVQYQPSEATHAPFFECRLSDSANYITRGSTIVALHLTVDHIRIGDGIEAYGKPDFHVINDDFHFMKWEMPPLTMVAHHVDGAWLMGEVNEVFLRG